MVPVLGWIETRDKQERAGHRGKNLHVSFGWVFIMVVGWCTKLFDAFVSTDLLKFAFREFFCVVVQYALWCAVLLNIGKEG